MCQPCRCAMSWLSKIAKFTSVPGGMVPTSRLCRAPLCQSYTGLGRRLKALPHGGHECSEPLVICEMRCYAAWFMCTRTSSPKTACAERQEMTGDRRTRKALFEPTFNSGQSTMQKPVAAGAPTLPVLTVKLARTRSPTFQSSGWLARRWVRASAGTYVSSLGREGQMQANGGMPKLNSAFTAPSLARMQDRCNPRPDPALRG